ncbi:pyridoxamine 5'-phosphate oxidase family protein [Marisediminicola sp. LYQ85]|uniref:pyridoxamine 5'-phosphate oxidase family protein n=1 Tax=Marisediminicola sp. LYQ85 TaxID=3391062 RepID=UPI0039839CB8
MTDQPAAATATDDTLHADPHEIARHWLPGNEHPDRPQITLVTNGLDGYPTGRTVLLSEVTDTGFAFHTDARSRKALEIEADARVCIVVVWPDFYRQLVIHGEAHRQSEERIAAAYHRRSPYLKQLAWVNDADYARLPYDERVALWSDAQATHPEGPVDPSPTWVGFDITPVRYLFWESSPVTASRRTEFRRDGSRADARVSWAVDHLPG